MEAALIAIDAIIATKPVRWLLLVVAAMLLVVSAVSLVRQYLLGVQLRVTKAEKAEYAAHLLTQNAAIIKAGQEYQAQQKKAQTAAEAAARLAERLKQRRAEIREVVLQGDCPDMVQQVIDEVRK